MKDVPSDKLSNDTLVDNVAASAAEFATKTFLRRCASHATSQQTDELNQEDVVAEFAAPRKNNAE